MKKYKSRFTGFYFIHAIALCLLTACSFNYQPFIPFCISKPIIILDKREELETSCNLFFTIKNTNKGTIEKVNFVFSAYEGSNKKALTTKYLNEMSVPVFLPHGESIEVFIDLEPLIFKIPDSDCIVDFFCIKEVVFSNGDVWKDIFCTYAYSLD